MCISRFRFEIGEIRFRIVVSSKRQGPAKTSNTRPFPRPQEPNFFVSYHSSGSLEQHGGAGSGEGSGEGWLFSNCYYLCRGDVRECRTVSGQFLVCFFRFFDVRGVSDGRDLSVCFGETSDPCCDFRVLLCLDDAFWTPGH
jgi:hypothetical protein